MAPTPQPPFDQLVSRAFSFYPPIVGIEHNEWVFRQATWSEALVGNTKTQQEIWIPRQYVGEVSRIDDPVMILGLNRELEYKSGMIVPYQRRVLKMPEPVFGGPGLEEAARKSESSPVRGVRLELSDRRAIRLIGIALGAFLLLYLIAVSATRIGDIQGKRVVFTATDTSYQELTPRDDRFAVIAKLGQPSFSRSKEVGSIRYEALTYAKRKYTVLLMGQDANDMAYIGSMDDNWKPIHSVAMKTGGNTESLLRAIQRF